MTGFELDLAMRAILVAATRETALSSTAALIRLGFGAQQSFSMIENVLAAKAKAQ